MVKADREIRDPVHGLIRLSDQEIRIIDSPTFQRLRRIKQLALAQLVYPGALHTRFEHSLGTMHVASQIMEAIARKEHVCDTDIEIVRLASLLHDIGHGPFSHVSEYLLEACSQPQTGAREKIHERLTVDIVTNEQSIGGSLSDQQKEAVCRIIQGTTQKDVRRDVVSSNLDADKIDYLARDAHYAGVKYGAFDADKIIDSFTMVRRGQESYLAIEESAIFAVEQLIIAKYHMTQQVYAHRIRVITDSMIVRGLMLAIEDGLTEVKDLYTYDSSPEYCENYTRYDDESIFDLVLRCNFERPQGFFERLRSRRLFKQVLRLPLDATISNNIDAISLYRLGNLSAADKQATESRIATELNCHPWEVIVDVKNVKHPAYQSPGVLDPEDVLVISDDLVPKRLNSYQELVSAKLPAYETLHVIAPHTWQSGENQPSVADQKRDIEVVVKEVVIDHVGGGT